MFLQTTAQDKIRKLRNRVRIVQGGTSSSKTFSILPMLITYASNNANAEISVVSESIPHLKRGAIRDFLKIMDWTGNMVQSRWNKSSLTYTFYNGSFIEFFSADQPDKLRGARRDVLFINECNNINFESYQQLAIRTRKFIYLDYNPTSEFWVHTELMNDVDSEHIILTYKDNEALPESIVNEIEKAKEKALTSDYWSNWWRVYGLGEVGHVDGLIFTNWNIVDSIPESAKYLGSGMDFGFTNDPTALIDLYQMNGELWVNQSIYETQLTNPMIAERIKLNSLYHQKNIIADSSEPKSIAELQSMGIRVQPAKKGQGSVNHGIDILQRQKINVTSTSLELIKEFRAYKWDKDKAGKSLNDPIDYMNHGMDALRYIANYALGAKNVTKPFGTF